MLMGSHFYTTYITLMCLHRVSDLQVPSSDAGFTSPGGWLGVRSVFVCKSSVLSVIIYIIYSIGLTCW